MSLTLWLEPFWIVMTCIKRTNKGYTEIHAVLDYSRLQRPSDRSNRSSSRNRSRSNSFDDDNNQNSLGLGWG
jgi:hypothetical protein